MLRACGRCALMLHFFGGCRVPAKKSSRIPLALCGAGRRRQACLFGVEVLTTVLYTTPTLRGTRHYMTALSR